MGISNQRKNNLGIHSRAFFDHFNINQNSETEKYVVYIICFD